MHRVAAAIAARFTIRRAAASVAATGLVGTSVSSYFDDDTRRAVTIGTMGPVCRLVVRGLNHLHVHDIHHLEKCLERPVGTGLLTISNHIATIDDPHLIAAVVPPRLLLRGSTEMRWGVCAADVCFKEGSLLAKCADAAKVLPVRRGAGVFQAEIDVIIQKLKQGDWVHYFPEGKIRQDGRVHTFRRGVGRIIASIEKTDSLQVLPFYHIGLDTVQPTTPDSTSVLSKPNLGAHVHVIFGAPVDLTRWLAMRSHPPFDKKPMLLYEVIAHVLEEEVRSLRAELHRRI
jgi:monolysocardiolipin acyltransferase